MMIKDDVLACPNCSPVQAEGNDYLHHFAMTVYRRSQEDDPTEVQNIDDIAPCHEREPDAGLHPNPSNPSLRRDGIRIWFDCELCGQIACLCISQHKGQTFIYMESKKESWKDRTSQDDQQGWNELEHHDGHRMDVPHRERRRENG